MGGKFVLTKIQRHGAAFDSVLGSPEVEADLKERAERIQEATGSPEDFEVRVVRNRDRVVAFVRTRNVEGRRAEAEERALTRAVDAGR